MVLEMFCQLFSQRSIGVTRSGNVTGETATSWLGLQKW